MAITIPTDIPSEFRAGDTWQWTKTLTDYPATAYTAAYHFVKAADTASKNRYDAVSGSVAARGSDVKSAACTASGSDFAVTVTATLSAAYRPGTYRWALKVTQIADTGIKYTVEEGTIIILPDVSAVGSSTDERSAAQLIVEQCDAAVIYLTRNKHASYQIGDKSFNYQNLDEISRTRNRYASIARKEKGLGPQLIEVQFD